MRRIVCKEENFNKGSGVDLYYTRHEFLIKCVFFKKKTVKRYHELNELVY